MFVCEILVFRKIMNFLFYVLKIVFLFYVYGDNRCKKLNLLVCIKEVFEYLFLNLFYVRMLCFFVRDMNIWWCFFEMFCFRWILFGNLKGMFYLFELCWIKLMFEFINYLKLVVYENCMVGIFKMKDDYEKLIFKCNYFKVVVSCLIKLYLDWF